MSNLTELIKQCNGRVYLDINGHKNGLQFLSDYIESFDFDEGDLHPDIREMCFELDSFVYLQIYPNHGSYFYLILDYDVNSAINRGLSIVKNNKI